MPLLVTGFSPQSPLNQRLEKEVIDAQPWIGPTADKKGTGFVVRSVQDWDQRWSRTLPTPPYDDLMSIRPYNHGWGR
jgi:hypothetical protein